MKLAIALLAIALAAPGRAQTYTQEPCPVQNADGAWVSGTCQKYHPAKEFANPRVNVKLIDDKTGEHVRLNLPVTHRTFDRTFTILAGVSQALTIADNEYSLYTLKHDGAYEINPLLGRHPSRGTYYAVNEAFFALTTYVSYRTKREHDAAVAFGARTDWTHRIWSVPMIANAAVHAVGIILTAKGTGR